MTTRKQLEKENQKLKIKLEVEKHRKGYIHVPFSWPGLGRIALLLLSIALAVGNVFLIISARKLLKPLNESINKLLILYPLVGGYILIGLVAICLVAVIKGGFNKIKSYEEISLIYCLIVGLIFLLCGLIIGLIFGLATGLMIGIIHGLMFGLIMGVVIGLMFALFVGLIFGLIFEFE